jgi:hypothetical protein
LVNDVTKKLLAFAAVVEVGTGMVVILVPALVVKLLLGFDISGDSTLLARCFGIALVALSFACWPGRQIGGNFAPFLGMLIYNASIALYLGWLGAFAHLDGLLLWPAVVVHAIVAVLLPWSTRKQVS